MLSVKENFLETIKKGGKPDRVVVQWGPLFPIMIEPCQQFSRGMRAKGKSVYDRWGVYIIWPEDQPASVPHVTPENKVVKDITRWRDYLKVPDIATHAAEGWDEAKAQAKKIREDGGMVTCFMGTGMFEQMHALMGFEDALLSMLEEPEAVDEMLEAIYEYRSAYAKLLIENLEPDAVLSHDDWGTKTSLFMSPGTWRTLFKDRYKRFYKPFKDIGALVIHHADSFCEPIVEDMAEIGIDIWQGVLPQNNIPKIQKILDGRMALMGGIDAGIVDAKDAAEEVVRAEVRRACDDYVPGGNFIPNLPNGLRGGAIFPRTVEIIDDEIRRYRGKFF